MILPMAFIECMHLAIHEMKDSGKSMAFGECNA
jgi:hypothetical protein